ncbi:MAG: alpha-amylase family glycosyl hydrolase, partial [Bacteroidales bacterium]
MKRISCAILVGVWVLMQSCSPSLSRKPFFDTQPPAGVLTLYTDSTVVLAKDYFPSLTRIDKVESPHLKVLPYPNTDTVLVVVQDSAPLMTVLHVHTRRQRGDIPVRIQPSVSGLSARTPRLAVFPSTPNTDALCNVHVEMGPVTLYIFWQNSLVQTVEGITDAYPILLPGFTALPERSMLRVYAVNEYGHANDLLIPLEKGRVVKDVQKLKRTDKHTAVIYQVFIDRFYNGNPDNDYKIQSPHVHPKVDYYGGDLEGVIQKMEEGFFNQLGVNTIWLSPLTQNPYDAWGQIFNPDTQFSGYHGYWPLYITQVDKRFGDDRVLTNLLD